ncbi:MAG: hypothetical protein ACJAYF_001531 [Arenicella sp.]|jgi:hypothetical protein
MKFIKLAILGASLLVSQQAHSQVFTLERNIGLVDVFANGDVLIIPNVAGGWGAEGCPAAFFVKLSPSIVGYSEILATILTARAAELPVRIDGTCNANPSFFNLSRIRIQP